MKKSLLSVLFLCLILASFSTAGAKKCGNSEGGYTLDPASGALTFDDACTYIQMDLYFCVKNGVVSIDLSNTSATSIANESFAFNPFLASVKFPNSLLSIGHSEFDGCTSLTSIDLSNTSLTTITANAFGNCASLASIDLSNTSITSIGSGAFSNLANPSTITVTKGSKTHELLGGLNSVTGDPINSFYGDSYTTLVVVDPATPTPTSDQLKPTSTPEPGTTSVTDVIHVEPLPEDEYGSYRLDPVTGEKTYLLFHTYDICMNFLNNDALCSGYDRCYHK